MNAIEALNEFRLLVQELSSETLSAPYDLERIFTAYDHLANNYEMFVENANRVESRQAGLYKCFHSQAQILHKHTKSLEAERKVRDSFSQGISIVEDRLRMFTLAGDDETSGLETLCHDWRFEAKSSTLSSELDAMRLGYAVSERLCIDMKAIADEMELLLNETRTEYWAQLQIWKKMIIDVEGLTPIVRRIQIKIAPLLNTLTTEEIVAKNQATSINHEADSVTNEIVLKGAASGQEDKSKNETTVATDCHGHVHQDINGNEADNAARIMAITAEVAVPARQNHQLFGTLGFSIRLIWLRLTIRFSM